MPNYITTQIPGVRDPSSYSKPPLPPNGVASWLRESIAQPFAHKQYIPLPYDINQYIWSVNVVTYFKPPVVIFFSNNTISQPLAVIEYLIPNASIAATYFKAPSTPLPVGFASWASRTIAQPYIVTYDINAITSLVSPATLLKLNQIFVSYNTISQPVGSVITPIPQVVSAAVLWALPVSSKLLTRLLLGVGM